MYESCSPPKGFFVVPEGAPLGVMVESQAHTARFEAVTSFDELPNLLLPPAFGCAVPPSKIGAIFCVVTAAAIVAGTLGIVALEALL